MTQESLQKPRKAGVIVSEGSTLDMVWRLAEPCRDRQMPTGLICCLNGSSCPTCVRQLAGICLPLKVLGGIDLWKYRHNQ